MGLLRDLELMVESKPFEMPPVELIDMLKKRAIEQNNYLFWDKGLTESNKRWLEKEGFNITEAGYVGYKIWFYNLKH